MRRLGTGLLCTSLLLAPAATAFTRADGPAAGKPASRPAAFDDLAVMPVDRIDRVPLADVLAMIKAKQPAFHYVIFRGPNVPAAYPVLPPMALDGVTVRQFLQLVETECPGVSIRQISNADQAGLPQQQQNLFTHSTDQPPADPTGPLVAFDVRPTDDQVAQNLAGYPKATHDAAPPATVPTAAEVRVYHISPIVSLLVMRKAHTEGRLVVTAARDTKEVLGRLHDSLNAQTRQATNDVLSLLQATLDEAECGPVTLKAHEATQTIVFKGSPAAQAVLEKTLATLSPTDDEQRQIDQWRSSSWTTEEVQSLRTIDDATVRENDKLREANDYLSNEADRLQRELDQARGAKPATRPKG